MAFSSGGRRSCLVKRVYAGVLGFIFVFKQGVELVTQVFYIWLLFIAAAPALRISVFSIV